MFQKTSTMFLYTVSPVHMGAGTAVGFVDNPIQRECHTRHPYFAGSGIKGAVRHSFDSLGGNTELTERLFGSAKANYAGAVSFGDAQLVVFPVRSLKGGYVYATCPQALARAQRILQATGNNNADWNIPNVSGEKRCVVTEQCQSLVHDNNDGKLYLEMFEYQATPPSEDLAKIAEYLSNVGLSEAQEYAFFRNKLRQDLILLSDTHFSYFVEHATAVETHVRINEETGAAADGGLFYKENLPPECLLLAPLFASRTHAQEAENMEAEAVLHKIHDALHRKLLQLGGDSTTGRGLVLANISHAATEV